MELLYIWINQSENNVFENQGINLSPEFNFVVDVTETGVYFKEDMNWQGVESIFKTDTIVNVTAVVGKNGAGKTTLLKFLYQMHRQIKSCIPGAEGKFDLPENELIVVGRDEGSIVVFYNTGKEKFYNETSYLSCQLKMDMFSDENVMKLYDLFDLFFTNSNYSSEDRLRIDLEDSIKYLSIANSDIEYISRAFYRRVLDLNHPVNPDDYNHLNHWAQIYLQNELTTNDFQSVCDNLYYFKLIEDEKFDNYMGKKSTVIYIKYRNIVGLMEERNPDFRKSNPDERTTSNNLYPFYCAIEKFFSSLNELQPNKFLMVSLSITLVFEYCLFYNHEGMPSFDGLLDNEIEWIEKIIDTDEEYFIKAIAELKSFIAIIKNSEIPDNGYRPRDIPSYKDYVIINYDENKLNYKAFVNFINELFNQDKVFVLRYIKFDNMGMSTGERAFQNLFSRLNLVPKMNTIIAGNYRYSKNYLLLIDEIDLYLHPEWQQEFISVLLNELEKQFPDKKIQLVFSTHSPLLLSDIPKENTVYLRGNDGKTVVDNRSQHKQTFGRDIYNLLEDSFYIENYSMGKYALDYINSIINILLDESHNYREFEIEQIETLTQRINLIGNDVVKNKLKTMLLQCTKDKKDYQIKLLKEKRDNLNRQIAELED